MNCYNCGGFGHIVKYCRNRRTEGRIGKGRMKYRGNENNGEKRMIERKNGQNNLNRDRDLIVLD